MSNKVKSIDFWFCKIHIAYDLFYSYKIGDLVDGLIAAEGTPLMDRNNVWHLGGLKKETIESTNEVLFGKIGKEIFSNNKTVYDTGTKDFIETTADETHADYCIFVIDIKSYIIAIESRQPLALSKIQKQLKLFCRKN